MRPQRKKINRLMPGNNGKQQETLEAQILEIPPPNNKLQLTPLDISNDGMGISCLTPLKVGQHILFTTTQEGWDLPEEGIVMWIFKTNYSFRAGIKFI